MKKVLFVLLLALAPAVFGQVNFVRTTPAKSVALTSVADVDTIFFGLPKNLNSPALFDTTRANFTVAKPAQDFVSAQGKFTLFLKRASITGAADSFRVWIKKVDMDGFPVRNDSVIVLGTATGFSDFVSRSQYEFVINGPCMALAICIKKGDGGSIVKTTVTAQVNYTQ